jgi:hypothetical protein
MDDGPFPEPGTVSVAWTDSSKGVLWTSGNRNRGFPETRNRIYWLAYTPMGNMEPVSTGGWPWPYLLAATLKSNLLINPQFPAGGCLPLFDGKAKVHASGVAGLRPPFLTFAT